MVSCRELLTDSHLSECHSISRGLEIEGLSSVTYLCWHRAPYSQSGSTWVYSISLLTVLVAHIYIYVYVYVYFSEVKIAQSCPTLATPCTVELPGFSVHGILQARILEWVAISFSRASSQPRNRTQVSCIVGRFFTNWAMGEAHMCIMCI